jgi:secreted protein with Ig-like and vWFA domain
MFISKLRPEDSIGIVVFDTSADVLIQPVFKRDFSPDFFNSLDSIKTRGGTTIASGLVKSK